MKVESLKRLKSEKLRVKNCFKKIRGLEDKKVSHLNKVNGEWRVVNSSYRAPSAHLCGPLTTHDSPLTNKAFTLAEVLITLGIIGVVAALTMPTLVQNHKRHVVETQLKKAYSELYQSIKLSESKYGLMETWNFANFDSMEQRNEYFADNYIIPNIKIIKNCRSNLRECYKKGDIYTLNNNVYFNINQMTAGHSHYVIITSSGYAIYFWLHDSGDGGWFFIDTDGPEKGKNVIGKDIFEFSMTWSGRNNKLGLYPNGFGKNLETLTSSNVMYACNINAPAPGLYCSALIANNSWKIPDNYPIRF